MSRNNEQTPLLQERWSEEGEDRTVRPYISCQITLSIANIEKILRIQDLPEENNPREWPRWNKMANVAVIAGMSSVYCRYFEDILLT